MLLKLRGLPPKAIPRFDTTVLAAVEGSDESVAKWFSAVRVSRKSVLRWLMSDLVKVLIFSAPAIFLEQRQSAEFSPEDPHSLDLRYISKLIRETNSYKP